MTGLALAALGFLRGLPSRVAMWVSGIALAAGLLFAALWRAEKKGERKAVERQERADHEAIVRRDAAADEFRRDGAAERLRSGRF